MLSTNDKNYKFYNKIHLTRYPFHFQLLLHKYNTNILRIRITQKVEIVCILQTF